MSVGAEPDHQLLGWTLDLPCGEGAVQRGQSLCFMLHFSKEILNSANCEMKY